MVKRLAKTKMKNLPTNILIPFSLYRYNKSLTYRKLPEKLLNLSVRKLDGSSFSFHVARNATVASLKLAIEEEYCISSEDERENIWSLVWSHFCLCYKGQKLTSEKACIQKYGIKDGDQLQFIQHLTIDLSPTPRCSVTKNHGATIEDQKTDLEYFHHGEDMAFLVSKSKQLTHSLKELLSCSRFQC